MNTSSFKPRLTCNRTQVDLQQVVENKQGCPNFQPFGANRRNPETQQDVPNQGHNGKIESDEECQWINIKSLAWFGTIKVASNLVLAHRNLFWIQRGHFRRELLKLCFENAVEGGIGPTRIYIFNMSLDDEYEREEAKIRRSKGKKGGKRNSCE